MLVLMKYVIGVIYGRKCMKNVRKYIIWAIFGDMYRYTLSMYRYMLGSGHFGSTCTGTGQGCTGTCDALFPILTSFRILAITFSFLILFE